MENKQTAIQKLSEIVENMIEKSFMANQDNPSVFGYQMASVEIKKYIEGLLLMEKQQIIDAANHGVDHENSPYENANEYYEKTYGK